MSIDPEGRGQWFEVAPGIRRRTIAAGEKMMQVWVQLDAGGKIPEHRHPHEQIACCISGTLHLTLDGVLHELRPGMAVHIPGNAPHSADVGVDTIVIDTFSPPREDMLQQDAAGKR
jgi:quercetin dioxygenase-like cupin family protein